MNLFATGSPPQFQPPLVASDGRIYTLFLLEGQDTHFYSHFPGKPYQGKPLKDPLGLS